MIAIHEKGDSFTKGWIEFCESKNLPYRLVNCYSSNIIEQLKDCKALMWHFSHMRGKDLIMAHGLLNALEHGTDLVLFPKWNDRWHFDDKLAQNFIANTTDFKLAKGWVFYDYIDAKVFLKGTNFPKVFKLRGGSGSRNVLLIENESDGKRIARKMFGKGISNYSGVRSLTERIRKFRKGTGDFGSVVKGIYRLFRPIPYTKIMGRELGYFYIQEFVSGVDCDFRVMVIGEKAIAIKRMVREKDFRASGSGELVYDRKQIPSKAIKLAFEVSEIMNFECMSYDIVMNEHEPIILEFSYGVNAPAYENCEGFWDRGLNFSAEKVNIAEWMVEIVQSKIGH